MSPPNGTDFSPDSAGISVRASPRAGTITSNRAWHACDDIAADSRVREAIKMGSTMQNSHTCSTRGAFLGGESGYGEWSKYSCWAARSRGAGEGARAESQDG